jgi:hypothetical protein
MSKINQTTFTRGFVKASSFFFLVACVFWFQFINAQENETPAPQDIIEDLKLTGKNAEMDDLRALKAEMLIAKNEKRALKQIKKLLRKYKGSPMEAGLWFRLAELHMRRARADRFFEVNRQSETLVKFAPKLVKNASAKNNIQKAINIYDKIERSFPYFRDMDLVLFNSGFARQQINKNAYARKLYKKLIREYSDSPLVPDSHLAIGEMLFEEKKYKQAKVEFEAIKNYPQSRVYPYGRYKLAWTLYNLEQTENGLSELEAVVAYSNQMESDGNSSRLDLKKEALTDMVLFYSETRPADKAVAYFVEQAGKEEAGFFSLKLMRLYNRHSKYLQEKQVFYSITTEIPQDQYVPKAYVSMVESFESQKKRDLAVFELERFSKVCDKDSVWLKVPENKLSECVDFVTKLSSNHAAKWHKLWKKNLHALKLADYAERAYRNYLSFKLVNDKANTVHFEYANLLFQRKKYRKASDEYFLVAQKVKKQPMLHDTSYSAIFSLQKAVADKWSKEDELRYVTLATHYLSSNPKGKYREDIEFKRAFIIYDNERYDEAAPLLADLGERYKNKKQGIRAQDLYLDILAKKKDFLTTKEYSLKLYKREKNKKRKASLKRVYQESYFASIEINKDPKQKIEDTQKAENYLAFAKANMDSDLAEKAWWNAVSLYKNSLEHKKTATISFAFYNKFPKSKLGTDSLKLATQNFERITDLASAAKTAELLRQKDPKNKTAWTKLAVEYYLVEGKWKQAESLLKEELNAPKEEQQKWAIEQLYRLALQLKDDEKQNYYSKFLVKLSIQPYAIEQQLKELDRLMEAKKYPEAFKLAGQILKWKGDLSYYKAKARIVQAEILKGEFERQSMNARPDRVAMVIALKTEKLEKAQKAYQSASRYKNPEVAIEAMIGLAKLYGEYARDMRAMKLKGVEEKDATAFYQEIENLVIPMEEREVETLAQALEAAKELQLGSSYIVRIRKEMDRLNMKHNIYFNVSNPVPVLQLPEVSGVGS